MDPQQILARLQGLTSSFSGAQLASLLAAFVLVVGVVAGSALWMNAPTYELLYADMDPETAGDVVSRLKTLKVAYKLDAGGRAVRVPSNRVDELRLELTSQGPPSTGRVGFEIFDRTAFGATEFLEKVNYRRALEGEIARTIATIGEVSGARVHIAMGKETLFGEPRPAKASVIVKLRGQRTLTASTVSGISNLVAASVEGLRPDAVVILDTFGRPLTRPDGDGDDPLGGAQFERQQRLEREMAARVVSLIEPVVGAERVRVNVALKLNPHTREETEERWDPNSVVRSRQMSTDTATGATVAGGVSGARANMPLPADSAGAAGGETASAPGLPFGAAGPASARNAETVNYEIGRIMRHTVQPPGDIARLSVAVIVDDEHVLKRTEDGGSTVTRTPRKPEELQKLQGLVAAAVGLEPDRGDQLTVENVSFEEPLLEEPVTATFVDRYGSELWEGARILGAVALGLVTLLVFVRPLMRRLGTGHPAAERVSAIAALTPAAGQMPRTVADLESEIEAQLDAASEPTVESRRLPVLTRRVSTLGSKEPENVAKLLRSWMSEPER